MDIFMRGVSETFSNYKIIMAMDRAAWHNIRKLENIVPFFQPAYSPEVNPVENLWHHIREDGGFTCTAYEVRGKNATFNTLNEVELRLVEKLKKLDEKTVKSITQFNWIKKAFC